MTSRAVIGSGIDADAAAFCRRSGATDRTTLSAFVRGVKGLGLWGNFVCWPMTGGHSAQSGTTVHSLGGLPTNDLAFTGSPVWGADGVTFTGTQHALGSSVTTFSLGAVKNTPNVTSAGIMSGRFDIVSALSVIQMSDTGAAALVSAAYTRGGFRHIGGAASGITGSVTGRIFLDGAFLASAARTLTSATPGPAVHVGNGPGLSFAGDQVAFAWIADVQLSDPQMQGLHELYRRTLGRGLGLP